MIEVKELFQQAFELHKQGKLDEAESLYEQVLELDPQNAEVLNFLGIINLQKFKLSKAEELIQKAISISPEQYFYENLAKVYLEMEDAERAVQLYTKLLKQKPDSFNYVFNLASAYKVARDYENAIRMYERAIELEPENPDSYYNMGLILNNLSEPERAIKYYKKAVELCPDDTETRYFTGITYFRNRDYKNGLQYFESRLCRQSAILTQMNTYPNLMQKAPLWDGKTDISDKTLYTYYEAGFGDVLMFARYLPMLKSKCKKLIVKPQVPLAELLQENFPDIEVMKLFEHESVMDFDYHVPILSLPYVLGLDESNMFVGRKQYLSALPEKIERYRRDYFDNDCFKIGIKWRGNTHYEMDRVIEITSFLKLFGIKNTKFYSFQTFEGAEDLNKIVNDYDIVDIGKTVQNFSDTAGALANLDLVICNDTSLAHLAGAMNIPCWILLPYNYNWRWHLDLSKCDWYESVKLYRQKQVGDWDEIFERMYNDLTKLLGN